MTVSTTDIDSEELVLSAVIDGDKQNVISVMEHLTEDDFTGNNQKMFGILRGMYINQETIDMTSVMKLHQEEVTQFKLRISYMELVTKFSSYCYQQEEMGNFSKRATKSKICDTLIKRLENKTQLRRLRDMSVGIEKMIQSAAAPASIYDAVEKQLMERTATGVNRSYLTPKEMAELMIESTAEPMDAEKRKQEVIFTSYRKLNEYTGGFERGDLIILSAASGAGKSAFAINIARDVSYVDGKAILYLNSEMSDKQQARRYASMLSGVSHANIRNGLSGNTDFNAVCKAADEFSKKKIYTVTIPDLQLNNVVAEIRRMKERFGVQMVIVDYIGRMDTMNAGKDAQEWQIMENAARTLKTMAQELEMVVIMVAQLTSDGNRLAKASSMKNECDLWMNLKHVSNEDRAAARQFAGKDIDECWNTIIEFRKARNVESNGKLLMHFHGDTLTFTDRMDEAVKYTNMEMADKPIEDKDVPA